MDSKLKEFNISDYFLDLYHGNFQEQKTFNSEKVYDKGFQESNSSFQDSKLFDSTLIKDINYLLNENSIENESILIENANVPKKDIILAYLKMDEIPKIQIINEHLMKFNDKIYEINDYLKCINEYIKKNIDNSDNLNDLLEDNEYDLCGLCKNNFNKYFCKNCNINICNQCYKKCEKEKHIILVLNELEMIFKNNLRNIKLILYNKVIPIKRKNIFLDDKIYFQLNEVDNENRENEINENFSDNKIDERNHEDIFLIIKIISVFYNNYFHYKNNERILQYCKETYSQNLNDQYEGKGIMFFPDGSYYIGDFENGLKNGKGIYYYENGKIQYEGDWFENKREGEGKLYLLEGSYYIGQFKDDLFNGKGIYYYKNGRIQYEGDWYKNKREGKGKLYYKNGYYLIGQFKNNKANGRITLFNNNKILYEGDYINGKFEGYGAIYYENDKYYEGQFKKNQRHGKGILYYKKIIFIKMKGIGLKQKKKKLEYVILENKKKI